MRYIRNKIYRGHALALFAVIAMSALLWFLGGEKLCVFKSLLGLPCPGCGLTRAGISLLNGDFSAAFGWHPLFFTIPLVLGVVIFRKENRVSKIYQGNIFWILILILFLGVYMVRMAGLFPLTPPMDFNEKAVIVRTTKIILSLLH